MLLIGDSDFSLIVKETKLKSVFNNGPDVLTFSYPADVGTRYPNGAQVIFTWGTTNLFFGWLFKTELNGKEYKCTAYDQRRYFKSEDSLLRDVEPLDVFLNRVSYQCGDRIRLGQVDSTEVKLNKYLFDGKTYLDMIYQSIEDNLIANGYYYALRDNFGALDLRDVVDLRLPLVVGDASLATDYNYVCSIDDGTANYIKVAKDDKEKGVRNTYIAKDESNMTKWGKLMLYDKVTVDLNDAQLATRANRLLKIRNKETEKLTIESIGDTRVFGGNALRVEIAKAGVAVWAVVDTVTHTFKDNNHDMKTELVFEREW